MFHGSESLQIEAVSQTNYLLVSFLTYWGLEIPYIALEILFNTGSGNGLLPDGTKPSPEPMLTYPQLSPVAFIWEAISTDIPQPPIIKISLQIVDLNDQSFFSEGPIDNKSAFVQVISCVEVALFR